MAPPLYALYTRLQQVDPDQANRRWIDLVLLGQEFDTALFLRAIKQALQCDRLDLETVRYLCRQPGQALAPTPVAELALVHPQVRVEHESVHRYDDLLTRGAGA